MQGARPVSNLAGGILGVIAGLLVTSPTFADAFSTGIAAFGLIPVLTIFTPIQNQTVSGTVPFVVQADSSGIVSLQFNVDGQNFGAAITEGSCRANWDSVQTGDGLHTIQAVGLDQFGNTTISQPVTVLVSNLATPSPPAPEPPPTPGPTPAPAPTPTPVPTPTPTPTPEPALRIRNRTLLPRPRPEPADASTPDPATPLRVPRPKPVFVLSLQTTGGFRFRLTSTLRKNSLALPGALVTFVVTGPEGSRQTYRATTDSEGVATTNGRLLVPERRGTYVVVATAATALGSPPVSTTGSFVY